MAITTHLYGPEGFLPDQALDEWQWLHLVGDGTEQIVVAGTGVLQRVFVGVVGTLAKFYDTAAAAVTDGTTQIATVDTSVLGERLVGGLPFAKGLTVVTTGSSDLTILFKGRPIPVTSRTYGGRA